jgi:hypothetical protein
MAGNVLLQPGPAFRLGPDGQWDVVEDVPEDVLAEAVPSGSLLIEGYRCVVFHDAVGNSWAQKSHGPADVVAALRIVAEVIDHEAAPSLSEVRAMIASVIRRLS